MDFATYRPGWEPRALGPWSGLAPRVSGHSMVFSWRCLGSRERTQLDLMARSSVADAPPSAQGLEGKNSVLGVWRR